VTLPTSFAPAPHPAVSLTLTKKHYDWTRILVMRTIPLGFVFVLAITSLSVLNAENRSAAAGGAAAPLQVSSPDFASGGDIPKQFTCSGADISPALEWSEPPAGTESFALIADDPDAPAGTWVHWVIYDLAANLRKLPQNVPQAEQPGDGSHQGRNDFDKIGYGGPCPPPGKPHRYFFKLYALDHKLNLPPGATKKDVESAMKGHILAQGECMGRFAR
jgi:Raf kinase inhibitor-like YbhB/YbcL family protein